MFISAARRGRSAFSRSELIVIIGIVGLLLSLAAALMTASQANRSRDQCRHNLKELTLGFKMWAGNGRQDFPGYYSKEKGHRLEYKGDGSMPAVTYFLEITNDIRQPKLLVCPVDTRIAAASWPAVKNDNLSYFINLEGSDVKPNTVFLGDRLLTGDVQMVNGLLTPKGQGSFQWTTKHPAPDRQPAGNISLSDGSVWSLTNAELTQHFTNKDNVICRFLFPE